MQRSQRGNRGCKNIIFQHILPDGRCRITVLKAQDPTLHSHNEPLDIRKGRPTFIEEVKTLQVNESSPKWCSNLMKEFGSSKQR